MAVAAVIALAIASTGEAQAPLRRADAVASAVVLHTPAAPGVEARPIGSGFLIAVDGRLFLATAEHVARVDVPRVDLTFADESDRPVSTPLSQISTTFPSAWVFHRQADAAVLELRADHPYSAEMLKRALPVSALLGVLEPIDRESPVTIIGYPLGLGGVYLGPDGRVSPLTREVRPASSLVSLKRADTKNPSVMFLLDSPSIEGYSGAPVFILPGAHSKEGALVFAGRVVCVGLMHGTWSDGTGGKLGAVVPARFVAEALAEALARGPLTMQ